MASAVTASESSVSKVSSLKNNEELIKNLNLDPYDEEQVSAMVLNI